MSRRTLLGLSVRAIFGTIADLGKFPAKRVGGRTRIALFLLCTTVTPAVAQSGPGEAEQQQACMGDALRLCFAYIPNRAQIAECMFFRRDQLSPYCRAVFDASAPSRPLELRPRSDKRVAR
jgi:hypothetical protein